jgi:hypothetical protein
MKLFWVEDEVDKKTIADLGIDFEDITINVSEIDEKASAQNRARTVAKYPEHVEGIYLSMVEGSAIPKIVVRRVGNKYVIAGGNHRFAAAKKAGAKTLPVYCVEATDVEFEQLCRVLNLNNGMRASDEENMKSAVDAVVRIGDNMLQVAKRYRVTYSRLQAAVKAHNVSQRLAVLAPKNKGVFTQSHVNKLGDVANNDNVLVAAASYVAATNAPATEIAELARKARSMTTEAEQVNVFTTAAAVSEKMKRATIPRTKRKQFLLWLSNAEKVLKGSVTWQSLELLNEEVPEVSERVKSVRKCLSTLLRVDG